MALKVGDWIECEITTGECPWARVVAIVEPPWVKVVYLAASAPVRDDMTLAGGQWRFRYGVPLGLSLRQPASANRWRAELLQGPPLQLLTGKPHADPHADQCTVWRCSAPQAMSPESLPDENQPPRRPPLRILYAEDQPAHREQMGMRFDCDGYSCECVSDGQQALDRITASPAAFDIVVTDHYMPHIDGLALVGRLRQTTFAGTILVFASALTQMHREIYAMLGVHGTFSNPVEAPQLLATLAELQKTTMLHG